MENNKVYVVCRDYDDWDDRSTWVLGVFTSEELAKNYIERLNKNKGKFEEFYYESFTLDQENDLL